MTGTLALLIRSLRVDARMVRAHLFRALFVLLIYVSLIVAQQSSPVISAPGLHFFSQMTYLNFLMITAAGTSYFATVITEEKEEGTLGLLRMAGINPVGLLLGKTMPRLIAAGLLLSVQFPFTFLAITLGGVTRHQVLAAYVALLAYLVMLAALGLLCSVICRRSRGASRAMVLALAVFLVVVPLARMILQSAPANWAPVPVMQFTLNALNWVAEAALFLRIWTIMMTGFADPVVSYQVWSNLLAAGVFFGLAWLAFDRFNRHDVSDSPERPFFFRTRRCHWLGVSRAWDGAAVAWKEFHFGTGGRTVLLIKSVLCGLVVAFILWFITVMDPGSFDPFDPAHIGGAMMLIAFGFLMVEPAVYASRMFHEERKWQTLNGLLLLPVSTARLAWSKVAGWLPTLIPAAAWFVLGAVIYPEGLADFAEDALTEPAPWWLVSQYLIFLHLTVLLSLFVKWGSLPLAFVLVYIGNTLWIGLFVMAGPPDDGIFAFFAFLGFLALIPLQIAIAARLRTLAGQ